MFPKHNGVKTLLNSQFMYLIQAMRDLSCNFSFYWKTIAYFVNSYFCEIIQICLKKELVPISFVFDLHGKYNYNHRMSVRLSMYLKGIFKSDFLPHLRRIQWVKMKKKLPTICVKMYATFSPFILCVSSTHTIISQKIVDFKTHWQLQEFLSK